MTTQPTKKRKPETCDCDAQDHGHSVPHGVPVEAGKHLCPGCEEKKLNQQAAAWKDSPEQTAKGGVPIRGTAPAREDPNRLPSATTAHLNSDKK